MSNPEQFKKHEINEDKNTESTKIEYDTLTEMKPFDAEQARKNVEKAKEKTENSVIETSMADERVEKEPINYKREVPKALFSMINDMIAKASEAGVGATHFDSIDGLGPSSVLTGNQYGLKNSIHHFRELERRLPDNNPLKAMIQEHESDQDAIYEMADLSMLPIAKYYKEKGFDVKLRKVDYWDPKEKREVIDEISWIKPSVIDRLKNKNDDFRSKPGKLKGDMGIKWDDIGDSMDNSISVWSARENTNRARLKERIKEKEEEEAQKEYFKQRELEERQRDITPEEMESKRELEARKQEFKKEISGILEDKINDAIFRASSLGETSVKFTGKAETNLILLYGDSEPTGDPTYYSTLTGTVFPSWRHSSVDDYDKAEYVGGDKKEGSSVLEDYYHSISPDKKEGISIGSAEALAIEAMIGLRKKYTKKGYQLEVNKAHDSDDDYSKAIITKISW